MKEYQKLTETNLYRTSDFGMIETKNEFEETLYFSSKKTQKELIQLIEEEIYNMTEKELKILKEKYDEQFLKYWSKGDGPSKFQPITMKEFKKRLTDEEFK